MFSVEKLKHGQLQMPIAIASGLVVCVLTGLLIGQADFSTLKRLGLFLLAVGYILFWQGHTWKVGIAICYLGFSHIGFGFRIGVVELSGIVAAFLIAITWWRKQRIPRPEVMELFCFRVFNLALLAWLIYSGGHAIYTIMDPFRPYDFALRNFLKTVVAMSGPPLLLFYFMHRPRGVIADQNMPVPLIGIGLTMLVINIAVRIWGILHGAYNPDLIADLDEGGGYFEVPFLDLAEGPFTLRALPLSTATIAAVLLGTRWLHRRGAGFRFMVYLVFILSFVGALMSGGRATVIFVFVLAAAALWMHGHRRMVLATLGACLFIFIALNLIPGVLRAVPPMLQRSLQALVLTDESEYAVAQINSSSSWRMELINRALAEWQSDRRIFWFGRGTYKFTMEDLLARKRNLGEGDMQISLRRGATHSLVTDLLVVHGVCGLVIYMTMMCSLLWFLYRVYKHRSLDEVGRAMTLASLLILGFLFVYGIVGGANFPMEVAWLLIALFGYLYGLAKKENARSPAEPREPPRFASRPLSGRGPVPSLAPVGARRFLDRP